MGEPAIPFLPWEQYYDFHRALRAGRRFFLPPNARRFLESIAATTASRVRELTPDVVLWRAQIGCNRRPIRDEKDEIAFEEPYCYSRGRMKPLEGRANEGRVNAKGAPVLYCASDSETAVAEVRPWIDSFISLARFRTTGNLKVVHCLTEERIPFDLDFLGAPTSEEAEAYAWQTLDEMFAAPVTPSDDVADYLRTQVIAELFRDLGCDGVAFRSTVGPGECFALFDPDTAECIDVHLVQVRSVTYKFEKVYES